MHRFTAKGLATCLSPSLSVLFLIVFISGSFDTVFAADDKSTAARPSQESLEIPGSFKDLPEARDAVTAKRPTREVASITPSSPASAELVVDADKVARPSGAVYADSEMVDFHATAYCLKGRTASGIHTRPGVIAADPSVLPLGTVVHLRAGRYTGTYTVMDTGGKIKGRLVDVYVPTYKEAVEFGRKQVKIKVIGRNSTKAAMKSLLEAEL